MNSPAMTFPELQPAPGRGGTPGGGLAPAAGLVVGCASLAVPGKWNEDRVGVASPSAAEIASHGVVVAVADGIGGDGSGAYAAAVVVRSLLRDYYATPESWGPRRALDRVLRACNDWLHGQNQRRREADAAVTTLSVVVFRAGHVRVAHVGDTRVYRLRAGVLKQLTIDHCWPRHDLRHVPKRAIGLDSHLVVDYADVVAEAGDAFLIATDGIWEVLGDRELQLAVRAERDPQTCADALVAQSMARQSTYIGRNDASCAVVRTP